MAEPTLMKADKVAIADIKVSDRLRPVYESGVEAILASVRASGVMKDPIDVRKHKDGTLSLIDGGHRLEMARRMGWVHIPAKVWTNVTEDWSRLMEIDGNLGRSEMNALDTAVFLATRKEVYERIHPETSASAFKGNRHTGSLAAEQSSVASFATVTAQKFGMTDRQVRKIVAAGAKLSPAEIAQLRAAPKAVSLADLQALAKTTSDGERVHVVGALADGTAKNAAAARAAFTAAEKGDAAVHKDPVEEAFKTLLKAWNRAPKRAKDRFLEECHDDVVAILGTTALQVAAE